MRGINARVYNNDVNTSAKDKYSITKSRCQMCAQSRTVGGSIEFLSYSDVAYYFILL